MCSRWCKSAHPLHLCTNGSVTPMCYWRFTHDCLTTLQQTQLLFQDPAHPSSSVGCTASAASCCLMSCQTSPFLNSTYCRMRHSNAESAGCIPLITASSGSCTRQAYTCRSTTTLTRQFQSGCLYHSLLYSASCCIQVHSASMLRHSSAVPVPGAVNAQSDAMSRM